MKKKYKVKQFASVLELELFLNEQFLNGPFTIEALTETAENFTLVISDKNVT